MDYNQQLIEYRELAIGYIQYRGLTPDEELIKYVIWSRMSDLQNYKKWLEKKSKR